MLRKIAFALTLSATGPVWSQQEAAQPQEQVPAMVGVERSAPTGETYNPDTSDDHMIIPPPVSGQGQRITPTSEERSNYLRAGLVFTGTYTDNVLGSAVNGSPSSDQSYSVGPMVALDQTTPRLHCLLSYAPAFTFYQHTGSRNQADHNAFIEFEYRLSPHVTFSAADSFQKSSNVLNQAPDLSSGGIAYGGAQGANWAIAPITDYLSNSGNVGLSYQYALNDMVGASGTFSNLHYPGSLQGTGLGDSSSQAGLFFYSHRVARGQYIGITYQYQRLLSQLQMGNNETQTHAPLFFYTYAPSSSRFTFSLFGGPQYSEAVQRSLPPQQSQIFRTQSWVPAGGASLGWQGRLNSFALSYTHVIAGGAGLTGAVQLDNATASARHQITRNLSVQLGYSWFHQTYNNVAVLANPDINRAFVSISYQFSRPLGR